jgi:hypothetical protein
LADLITSNIQPLIDPDNWKRIEDEISDVKGKIEQAATHF